MIGERLQRLIEAEIDGENSPAESRELQRALETDPGAAQYMREARAVADLLNGIPAADPPAGLRDALRQFIRERDQLLASRQVIPSRSPIERKGVSTMQNRKWILAAAAVFVAAIAVGYIALKPGPNPEDAAGTVGAVKKHHAPQITQQDVVLGTETAPAWAPYADFFNDAATLGNAAAKLEAASKVLESKSGLGSREAIAEVNAGLKLLQNQADDLTGRTTGALRLQVAEIGKTLESQDLNTSGGVQALQLQVNEIAAKLGSGSGGPYPDLTGLIDKVKVIQIQAGLGSSVDLNAINVKLGGIASQLQNASDLSGTNTHQISSALNDLRTQLGSAAAQDLSGRISADRLDMLGSLDLQANTIQNTKLSLAPIVGALEASSSLDAIHVNALKPQLADLASKLLEQKTQLEHKALTGLEGQLKIATLQSKAIDAIRDNLKLASKTLDARVAVGGNPGAMDLQSALGSFGQVLESSSLDTNRTVGQLVNAQIDGVERVLGSRAETLGSGTLEGLNQHVKTLDATVQGTVLGAKDLQEASGNLDRLKTALGNRSQTD